MSVGSSRETCPNFQHSSQSQLNILIMSNSLRQAATSMMFKLRSWLAKLRSHKHQEPSAEQGTSQADKLSTTSSEPVVKAAREPYQDSPNFAKFRKMHSSYSKAPLIHVYLEVIGATGIGVKSLVNKVINIYWVGIIRSG